MANTYSKNLGLPKPGAADRYWDVVLNSQIDALDALDVIGGLSVTTTEYPSATLNVNVAGGSFRSGNGTVISFAGTGFTPLALSASATSSIYLNDSGALVAGTTGFPAFGNIVPLATAVTGASAVASIVMTRSPWFARGGHVHWGVGAATIAAGPGAGTNPTLAIAGSDQAGAIALTTGTAPAVSAVAATVSFGQAFSAPPRAVLLHPANANASALTGPGRVWVDAAGLSTTQFTLNVGGAALAASTPYKWFYAVIG